MNHEIRLYDVIGGFGMTAAAIADSIPENTDSITVRINSPGGAVSDGLAIYNYLRDHSATVTTIVDGYAASAASIVMLAGDIRQVHESSIVVIHNPWTIAAGDSRDMRHNAEVLDELRTALISIYTDRTGIDAAELESLLDDETWMRGPVALEYGFADEVIRYESDEEGKQAASVHFARMLEILNEGNEMMSKQLTRKEIEAKLAEVEATVAGHEPQMAEAQAKIEEAQAVIAASESKIVEMQAEMDQKELEHYAAIEAITQGHETAVADLTSQLDQQTQTIDAQQASLVEAQSKVEKAEAALKNPAVADAAINNPGDMPNAVLDAEADAAEEAAKNAALEAEPKNVAEQWESMEAGADRVAFWNKHKRDIMAIIAKR